VIAGGNGAGKTTYYDLYLAPKGIPIINADKIARTLSQNDPESAIALAAILSRDLVPVFLKQGANFCYETVFSHPSKVKYLEMAKDLWYEVNLIYIHLTNSKLNEARVTARVSSGGHSVPVDKIHSRIPRTMKNIKEAIRISDKTLLIDNSSINNPFKQIAKISKKKITLYVEDAPEWVEELLKGYLPQR